MSGMGVCECECACVRAYCGMWVLCCAVPRSKDWVLGGKVRQARITGNGCGNE